MNSTITGRRFITACLIAALVGLAVSVAQLAWLAAHGQPLGHGPALRAAIMTSTAWCAITYLRRTNPRRSGGPGN